MAEIVCRILNGRMLVDVRGVLRFEEVLSLINEHYRAPNFSSVTWDLREADLSYLTPADLKNIAWVTKETLPRSPRISVAFVGVKSSAFLGTMAYYTSVSALAESSCDYGICESMEEADDHHGTPI